MKLLRFLEAISPSLVGTLAYNRYMNPQSKKLRPFEKAIYEQAHKEYFDFEGKKIAKYKWGNGTKKALLVHGWEGRVSNLGKVVPVLLEKGYQVIGFDGPNHGYSEKMKNPFRKFSDVIEYLLQEEKYEVLIAHSTGSTFALWCLHQLNITVPQVFICTTHNALLDTFKMGVKNFGLSEKTLKVMLDLFEKNVGFNFEEIVAQKFVKTIRFEKIIFIADEHDKVLPSAWTRKVQQAIPNSEMVMFQDTGHFRILWSEAFESLIRERVD
jgi:predicted alpha/beta hydrolase family esterase